MTTLVLNMLAHNSALTIGRALRSVRPYISAWCVGTSEGDIEQAKVIYHELRGIPGEIIDVGPAFPQGFASMRQKVYDRSRHEAEYMFWLDADDYIESDGPLTSELWCDYYAMRFQFDLGVDFERVHFVRCASDLRWEHRAHEGFFVKDTRPMGYVKTWRYKYCCQPASQRRLEMNVALSLLDTQDYPNDMSVLFGLAQNQLYLGEFESVQRIMALLRSTDGYHHHWLILRQLFFSHLEQLSKKALDGSAEIGITGG
jgi:hypothetical protein